MEPQQPMEPQPTCSPTRFLNLPVPLIHQSGSWLGTSLAAVCLRPTCRELAEALSNFTTAADELLHPRLLPCVYEQYGQRLSLRQRRSLVCKAADTGDVQLVRALASGPGGMEDVGLTGCTLSKDMFAAAAGTGSREVCQLLHAIGCGWDRSVV
jgi:hypothetical protein